MVLARVGKDGVEDLGWQAHIILLTAVLRIEVVMFILFVCSGPSEPRMRAAVGVWREKSDGRAVALRLT